MKSFSKALSANALNLKPYSRTALGALTAITFALSGVFMGALPQTATAQASWVTTPTWQHCSPNRGAVGPFYVMKSGPQSKAMHCGQHFLSPGEATGMACHNKYLFVAGGNDLWPQTTSSVPIYGFSSGDFNCA